MVPATTGPVLTPTWRASGRPTRALPPLAERRHALVHEEGGVERALGIVLVRVGGPEHGHDRVPDELLDEAVVALDRSRQLPNRSF